MGTELIIIVLLILMIVTAIIAVETKNILSAVIALGGIGFCVSVAFLFLRAPDIALTQIAVEVVCIIFLIKATISKDVKNFDESRNKFATAFGFILIFMLFLFSFKIFMTFKFGEPTSLSFNSPAMHYIKNSVKQTGASNVVTGILLDYRAYDTLGEATVLFTSILGAIVILRKKSKKKE